MVLGNKIPGSQVDNILIGIWLSKLEPYKLFRDEIYLFVRTQIDDVTDLVYLNVLDAKAYVWIMGNEFN
jgi:hypothetical protein